MFHRRRVLPPDRRLAGRGEHEDRHGPRRARDGAALTRRPPPRRARRPTPTPGRSSRRCASPNASTRSAPDPRSAPSPTATTTRSPRRPTGSTRPSASTGPTATGWDDVDELELATLSWVHWFNDDRLHSHCDDVPPAEFEAAFYAAQQTDPSRGWKPIARASIKPRAVQPSRSAVRARGSVAATRVRRRLPRGFASVLPVVLARRYASLIRRYGTLVGRRSGRVFGDVGPTRFGEGIRHSGPVVSVPTSGLSRSRA